MARRVTPPTPGLAQEAPPAPPKRHPLQFIVAGILLGFWLVFLAVMAFAA